MRLITRKQPGELPGGTACCGSLMRKLAGNLRPAVVIPALSLPFQKEKTKRNMSLTSIMLLSMSANIEFYRTALNSGRA
jgi:hypothetical protein